MCFTQVPLCFFHLRVDADAEMCLCYDLANGLVSAVVMLQHSQSASD